MARTLRQSLLTTCVSLALLLVSHAAKADEASDQYAVAAGHYAEARWQSAVDEFRRFLDEHPSDAKANEATFFLAEALLQSGRTSEAESSFRQYLGREPEGKFLRPALFRAGEAAYLGSKHDLARTDLRRFRSEFPDDKLNAYVLPYLGDIALGQRDVIAAARHFRDGLAQYPQGPMQDDCRFGLARALEQENQNEEAARLYMAVASKMGNPLADDAQFHLGALQFADGDFTEAIETFVALETNFPESPWLAKAKLGRGWALRNLNRPEEAKPLFEDLVDDPTIGVEARYWLGLTQKTQQDFDTAAKTLLAAIAAAGPDHTLASDIRYHAGDALLRLGEVAAASQQFDLVIASPTANSVWIDDALLGRVQAALQLKDHAALDRAAARFDERFPDSPLTTSVQRLVARSMLMRRNHDRAVELLEPLVAVGSTVGTHDDQVLEDRYLLALGLEGQHRYENALAVLLPVIDLADRNLAEGDSAAGPLKANAQLTHGSLLVAMQRYEDAIGPLQAFLAGDFGGDGPGSDGPNDDSLVKGRGELAICYARTDRIDEAKKIYDELLQEFPAHELIGPTTEQLAEAAYDAGDARWSAELFNRLSTGGRSPESQWKGLLGLGWSQFKADKLDEAAATFGDLLGRNPSSEIEAEAATVRGQIFEQLGQYDSALAMYDRVLENCPTSKQYPEVMLAAARLRDTLQRDEEAAELYRRLADAYPQSPDHDVVLYEWAWVLADLGEIDESYARFAQIHTAYPQSRFWADSTYRLAQRAYETKDYGRARDLTLKVLDGKAGAGVREHAQDLRGRIAVVDEDWPEVGRAFEALVNEFPESPRRLVADFWIAESIYRQDDYEAAGEQFGQLALRVGGRDDSWLAMIPLRRAQVLAHQKKWNEAHAIVSKIEARFPDFQQQHEVDYLLGRCLASEADFVAAREAYRKVIFSPTGEKTETAAMAQWMIGETFFHQKNYADALREYWKVQILYKFPTWQAASLLQAGKCHDLLGESVEADKIYAELSKKFPTTRYAREALARRQTPPSKRHTPK